MKRIVTLALGGALALTFATSAHAGQNHGSTSTTCPDKQTTTTRVPSSTTSLPSTTSSTVATSSSTTATTEPTSTTSSTVEETTTTVPATTTTLEATTTTLEATTTTTVAPNTTIQPSIGDAVTLTPQVGSQGELAETGFPYWNVALLGVGVLCLGFAGELIRKMAARS